MKLLATFFLAALVASANGAQGDNDMKPLILGGTEVPVGQKTYTCGLRETPDGYDFCGGTLITPIHVLTAAHCYGNIKYVSVGSHFLHGTQDGQQIAVKKQTKHPRYNKRSHSWDFLLLELEKKVDDSVPHIPFDAYGNYSSAKEMATVLGWGATQEGRYQSDVLLSVDVQVLTNEECSKLLNENIDDSMLCAGGLSNQDSCQGDSGGPLIVSKDGRDTLIGVVSWGRGCGQPGQPGVYSRISTIKDWLMQELFRGMFG